MTNTSPRKGPAPPRLKRAILKISKQTLLSFFGGEHHYKIEKNALPADAKIVGIEEKGDMINLILESETFTGAHPKALPLLVPPEAVAIIPLNDLKPQLDTGTHPLCPKCGNELTTIRWRTMGQSPTVCLISCPVCRHPIGASTVSPETPIN